MASEDRGEALLPLLDGLGLTGQLISDVEALLFHTRSAVPSALILEHQLISQVTQLDLVALLRRRKSLSNVPMICLGPDDTEVHAATLNSGADIYIELPTQPKVIEANLRRLWARREVDLALRGSLKELREMEQAFKASERMKDDLTHMLVHDLKSPIASVMGLLEHTVDIIKDSPNTETPVELLTLARVEAQHLLSLAANILDVRRMKEGHMPYHPARITSLTDVAQQALGDVNGAPRDRNFSFLVKPEAEELFADAGLLRRVLANLFSNGIKHTRRGGYIDFRAWKRGEKYVLSVRDDGEGIPEADLKRIFNAFEQSRHTVHDRYDTGMGLTFCKMAVEKHGGEIWVESKVGRGSTFFFTLPTDVQKDVTRQTLVDDVMALN